jgi:hypothetical protein
MAQDVRAVSHPESEARYDRQLEHASHVARGIVARNPIAFGSRESKRV